MNDPRKIRWLALLLAAGLLYVGIDRMFFDRIPGGDALAIVSRILAILAGTLLIALSIALSTAAWRGHSATASADSIERQLLMDALCAAPSALLFGFLLLRTVRHFETLPLTGTILFAGCLTADLLYTRRQVRPLAATDIAKNAAKQFLWSCGFFSMISFALGMALSGWNWFSTDFMRGFNLLFWSVMAGIAIFPVRRDAKGLADAAGPAQISSR